MRPSLSCLPRFSARLADLSIAARRNPLLSSEESIPKPGPPVRLCHTAAQRDCSTCVVTIARSCPVTSSSEASTLLFSESLAHPGQSSGCPYPSCLLSYPLRADCHRLTRISLRPRFSRELLRLDRSVCEKTTLGRTPTPPTTNAARIARVDNLTDSPSPQPSRASYQIFADHVSTALSTISGSRLTVSPAFLDLCLCAW